MCERTFQILILLILLLIIIIPFSGIFTFPLSLMTLKDTTVRVFHFFGFLDFFEKLVFETDEDSQIEE